MKRKAKVKVNVTMVAVVPIDYNPCNGDAELEIDDVLADGCVEEYDFEIQEFID